MKLFPLPAGAGVEVQYSGGDACLLGFQPSHVSIKVRCDAAAVPGRIINVVDKGSCGYEITVSCARPVGVEFVSYADTCRRCIVRTLARKSLKVRPSLRFPRLPLPPPSP